MYNKKKFRESRTPKIKALAYFLALWFWKIKLASFGKFIFFHYLLYFSAIIVQIGTVIGLKRQGKMECHEFWS
jgi:hypothetical protein